MNLFAAADVMIEAASYDLSNCFGFGVPTKYENGRIGEKVLPFAKSKPPVVVPDMEAAETQDTIWMEWADDHAPGSQERIELLRAYYEIEESKSEPRSASVLKDDEFAGDLIEAIIHCKVDGKETPMIAFIRGELRELWKKENLDG